MKEKKVETFKIIFKKLELEDNRELLQLTKNIRAIVRQVEKQEEDFEKISAVSTDDNQMYFSTGI